MTSYLDFDKISSSKSMCGIAIGMAVFWGIILELSKKLIYDALPSTGWWNRAILPTTSMMQNFGYPKEPTEKFPKGVTEPMARDFYAFLTTLCVQHFISAVPMIPVVYYGWEASSDTYRSLFVIGTLSDVGFDIYDAGKSTIRTFTKNSAPLPLDYWIIIVAMHHTMALSLVIPMNLFHVHLIEYHQAGVSLLLAGALCYGAGSYKFALNVKKKKDFIMYKVMVLFQLGVILYTRVYLWFPAAKNTIIHFRDQDDKAFFYGGCFLLFVFSVFNVLLVADGFKAAAKWLPKKMPKTPSEFQKATRDQAVFGSLMMPQGAFDVAARFRARRRLKGAVHSVIATNRLKKMTSSTGSTTSSKKD